MGDTQLVVTQSDAHQYIGARRTTTNDVSIGSSSKREV